MKLTPTLYLVEFQHNGFAVPLDACVEAHNPQAAVARAARKLNMKAKRIRYSWQIWHDENPNGKRQCYRLTRTFALLTP